MGLVTGAAGPFGAASPRAKRDRDSGAKRASGRDGVGLCWGLGDASANDMDFSDERWAVLSGGYRSAYDPRSALQMLYSHPDHKPAWEELWGELHHQGDIGESAYASPPGLAEIAARGEARDWNPFALAAIIEECRLEPRSPPLPDWLSADYRQAWTQLFQLALEKLPDTTEETLLSSLMAVLAARKALPMLARMAILRESERRDMLDEAGWA